MKRFHPTDEILSFISQTQLWWYLNRSLCPNHVLPLGQWSLQGFIPCLPEPHLPAHIDGDHRSRIQNSHHHISLWHFAQPVGVWWYRLWPTNHKEIFHSNRLSSIARNSTFIWWKAVARSPWDRNIFDFFEVQIDYLQVPCCHWRRDIWRSNQTTNQHNGDMTFIQKSPLICSQLFIVELWPLG